MSTILLVEDDDELREALNETLSLNGYKTLRASNGKEAIELFNKNNIALTLTDVRMDGMDGHQLFKELKKKKSDHPVIIMTAHGSIDDAVECMKYGAIDYISKPIDVENLLRKIKYHTSSELSENSYKPISESPQAIELLLLADKVAKSDATILISGESGTGKEVLARYIHDRSQRCEGPFIAINCAAIPEQMLEATLFGYEKGAFTGAYKASAGKFELANGGTLLLDEISEMDLALQAKLLRVLQEKEVERIGGAKLIQLDVRVLATTNRDMKEEIANKRFREDLYYRLNVFPLHWRPLRERREDIIPLAEYLIDKHWSKLEGPKPELTPSAKDILSNHDWPGNAREMDNVIQRAMILHEGQIIDEKDLHLIESTVVNQKEPSSNNADFTIQKKKHEFDLIENTIQQVNGSRKKACEKLGISERTLRYKLAEMREKGYKI